MNNQNNNNKKSKSSKDCLDVNFIKKNIDVLIKSMHECGINNPNRIKYFLAQCFHETGGFKHFQENLNYSAKGLLKVFPKSFKGLDVQSYARNPTKIANKVYGGKYGNTAPGDGAKYKGRGLIQITFKNNYEKIKSMIKVDIVNHPELVAKNDEVAIKSACAFFKWKNLNKYADKNDMEKISKTIQGSLVSLDARNKALEKIENSDIYKSICKKMDNYKNSVNSNLDNNISRDNPKNLNNEKINNFNNTNNFKDIKTNNSNNANNINIISPSNTKNDSSHYFSLDNRDIYINALKEQIQFQKNKEKHSDDSCQTNNKIPFNSYLNMFPPDKSNPFPNIGPNNNIPPFPPAPNNFNKNLGGVDFSNINDIVNNCRNIKFQGLIDGDRLLVFNKKNSQDLINQNYFINLEDLAVFLKILYDPTILNKSISFSLDPFEPTNPDGPYMRKVFYPDEIEKKNILQGTKVGEDMFIADYLMKQISLGYKPDNKTKFNYPKNLVKKGLKPIHLLNGSIGIRRGREWIITKRIETIRRKSGLFYVKDIKLGVDARELEISGNGTLTDKKVQNLNSSCYKFSEIFSNLYDEIAKYYPIFDRLKEIASALALAKYIYDNHYPIDFDFVEQIYKSTLIPNYQIKVNSIYHSDKIINKDIKNFNMNEIAESYLIQNNIEINQKNLEIAKNYLENNDIKKNLQITNYNIFHIYGGIDLWTGIIQNEENNLNESFNSLSTNNDEYNDIKITTSKNNELNLDLNDCIFFEFPFLIKNKKCTICGINLTLSDLQINEQLKNKYKSINNQYCNKHNPFKCLICKKLIINSAFFSFEGNNYHKQCLKCIYCSKKFDERVCKYEEGFFHKDCLENYKNDFVEKNLRYYYDNSPECEFCEEKIMNEAFTKYNNFNLHKNCFDKIVKKGIDPGKEYIIEGFKCYICKKIILGEYTKTNEGLSHIDCFNFIKFIIYLCYLYYKYK